MRTTDLTGALLDYYAGKAAGEEVYLWNHQREHYPMCVRIVDGRAVGYSPSTDWAHGGPIIEQEEIELLNFGSYSYLGSPWEAQIGCDSHYIDQYPGDAIGGSTPLIAAMRAIVASTFGDTVPDEVAP